MVRQRTRSCPFVVKTSHLFKWSGGLTHPPRKGAALSAVARLRIESGNRVRTGECYFHATRVGVVNLLRRLRIPEVQFAHARDVQAQSEAQAADRPAACTA